MKKSKIIQRKRFFLTRTSDGFEIVKYGPDGKLKVISEKDMRSLNKAIEENTDMSIGETLEVFVNVSNEKPDTSINKTYIKLKPGQINPALQ